MLYIHEHIFTYACMYHTYVHTWSTVPTLSDVKRNFSVFSLFGGITQRNLTSLSKSIDIMSHTYIRTYVCTIHRWVYTCYTWRSTTLIMWPCRPYSITTYVLWHFFIFKNGWFTPKLQHKHIRLYVHTHCTISSICTYVHTYICIHTQYICTYIVHTAYNQYVLHWYHGLTCMTLTAQVQDLEGVYS